MKRSELKQILKPLIKECIKEVIFEDGVLSGIISEVVQGVGVDKARAPITATPPTRPRSPRASDHLEEIKRKNQEDQQQLIKDLGQKTFGGVNVFENTTPLRSGGTNSSPSPGSPLSGVDPTDSGVDISGILNVANGRWDSLKG